MNKGELVSTIADKHELSNKQATAIVNDVFSTIEDCLRKGDDVKITGLLTFKVVAVKARTGVNPKTGEKIAIPASKRAKAKFSATFQKELNGK